MDGMSESSDFFVSAFDKLYMFYKRIIVFWKISIINTVMTEHMLFNLF